jgi:cyclase
MRRVRIIARLDIKGPNLIKGVRLEGLRVIGDPAEYAFKYYEDGIDELIYYDSVASLYERNNLTEVVKKTSANVFVPVTVGGGVRSIQDVEKLLECGADKVCLNTGAVKNNDLITDIANKFGSQCCVVEVQAKKIRDNKWEAYVDNGREHSGLDAIDWAQEAVSLGAGELIITSIDHEGTCQGYDSDLLMSVSSKVKVPIIASGGAGTPSDVAKTAKCIHVDGCAVAHILHHNKCTVLDLKQACIDAGVNVRVL